MAVANLKNLLGAGGGSLILKTGQSFSPQYGIGGVTTASLNVSAATVTINLTGRWAVTFIELVCNAAGAGTMTATLNIDGVDVLSSASVGTGTSVPIYGMQLNSSTSSLSSGQSPYLVCNSSLTLTIQRSTADTVITRYCALAIE